MRPGKIRLAASLGAIALGLLAAVHFMRHRSGVSPTTTLAPQSERHGPETPERDADLAQVTLDEPRAGVPQAPAASAAAAAEESAPDGMAPPPHRSLDATELTGDARGLALRFETEAGLPVSGATVDVNWRAGHGDYRDEFGETDSKGEIVTNVPEVFRLQGIELRVPGLAVVLIERGNDAVVDSARPHLVRFQIPRLRAVAVRVTDESGAPVKDATVEIDELETLSMDSSINRMGVLLDYDPITVDERGELRFTLQETAFEFEAESEELELSLEERVVLSSEWGDPIEVELQLRPPPPPASPSARRKAQDRKPPKRRMIHASVVKSGTGEPAAGAYLDLMKRRPFQGRNGDRVKSDGTLVLEARGTSAATWFLVAYGREYARTLAVVPAGYEDIELTVTVEPAMRIEGRAVTGSGAPVPGRAYLFPPEDGAKGADGAALKSYRAESMGRLGTGPDGRFHFNEVSSANYRIRFVPEDAAQPPVSVTARGGDKNVVIVVDEIPPDLATVRGQITNSLTGDPVPGLKVVFNHSDLRSGRTGETNQLGNYEVAGLDPGAYVVTVRHKPEMSGAGFFARRSLELTIPPGPSEQNLSISPARRLPLLLLAGTPAQPLGHAKVFVFSQKGQPVTLQDSRGYEEGTRARTTWQGRVDLWGIPAERVELRVWAEGVDPKTAPPTYREWIDATDPIPRVRTLRF